MKRDDRFVDIDQALKELKKSINAIPGLDTFEYAHKVDELRSELYAGINRWESIEIARHIVRPGVDEFIASICDSFLEVFGDRISEDDPAVIGGLAVVEGTPAVVIAHKKRSSGGKDYIEHHYGMASPSGHYKAMRLMKLAEKFFRPLITFVDTPGAYPIPDAEDRGQAFSIARCIATIASVRTPVIACIIGEAGSGGALALGFGDRIIMLENAFYSSISPEGFSSIIQGDASNKENAADSLRGSGRDLYAQGIVDYLIREPVGGAHNDPTTVIEETGKAIRKYLKELLSMDIDDVLAARAKRIENLTPHTRP
jgi:acetyl-CoA carboxylase carboxyl transferase subunit alpha